MRKLTALGLLALAAPLAADTSAPGFGTTALPSPGPTFRTVTLSNGQMVGLSSGSVRLFTASGALIQVLHTFSTPSTFPVEIAADPSETFVIVSRDHGSGEGGQTHRVELTGGGVPLGPGPVPWIEFEDGDSALYSQIGFPGTWTLYRVEVVTGAFVELIDVNSGFVGGPIALDGSGNLYVFRDSFLGDSTEGGSDYEIERFTPSQFAAPGALVLGEGVIVYQGSQFPLDLALSSDDSTLFVAETGRIVGVPLNGPGSAEELVSIAPGEDLWDVQFLQGVPPAEFLAFQPASGGELVYQTEVDDDWQRKSLRPKRPVLTLSGPGTTGVGTVNLRISGGPQNGQAAVFRGPLELFKPSEVAIFVAGIPIFIGLDLATAVMVPVPIPLDPSGNALRQFNNASGATGIWALQAALRDPLGVLVGSTTAAFL